MASKKTNIDIDNQLKLITTKIVRTSNYVNSKTNLNFKCLECGYEWTTRFDSLLSRGNCPQCYYKSISKSSVVYDLELKNRFNDIIRIDDYVNNHTTIKHQCLKCNNFFSKTPSSVLSAKNTPCTICNNFILNNDTYDKKLLQINPNILRLENYIKSDLKISHKCLKCGYEWKTKPNILLNGHGCPQCSGKIKTNSKYDKELAIINPDIVRLDDYINDSTSIRHKCIICDNIWKIAPTNSLKNRSCPKCVKIYNEIRNFKKVINIISTYVKPEFSIKEYTGVRGIKYKWKCVKCNNIFNSYVNQGLIPRCLICYPLLKGTSLMEKDVEKWLSTYTITNPNKRFYFNKINYYEVDIYLPEYNIGIEFDGIYWHSEVSGGKDKKYHINKTLFFKNKGIQIIHIFENEWCLKQNIVKNIILSKLSKIDTKIYARNCTIKYVDTKEVKMFLELNHLQGYAHSNINIGLYYKNVLYQILTFGRPRYNTQYDYELIRFSTLLGFSVVGGFSKIISFFKKNNPNSTLITYCDYRYSIGNVYIKNNFNYVKLSSPNYFYINRNTLESRIKYQKHKLSKILPIFDPLLTEWENMQLNGYDRIWDCGNLVYELNT